MSPLNILYRVNGVALGHATRSEVVIKWLLGGHDVRVGASSAAFRHLRARLPRVENIFDPTFAMDQGEIRRWATVRHNLAGAPSELPATVRHWLSVVAAWRPDVVITDFEPLSGIYARTAHVPLVSVGNIHMLDRCRHDEGIVGAEREDFAIARAVTRAMVAGTPKRTPCSRRPRRGSLGGSARSTTSSSARTANCGACSSPRWPCA